MPQKRIRKIRKTKRKVHKRQPPGRSWFYRLSVVGVWCSLCGVGVLVWLLWDMPWPSRVLARASRMPSVTLLAADGSFLAHKGEEGRPLTLSETSPHLIRAIIATEDRRFYEHPGIDVFGLLRALVIDVMRGHVRQGGSTLTQQVAKTLFLSRKRTIKRKVQELALALWLEHHFTKDQILTLYLNKVYLGEGAYGFKEASETYFGRPPSRVTLLQAAILAGMLKAPSRYNPFVDHGQRARERASVVLQAMVDNGDIRPQQRVKALRSSAHTVNSTFAQSTHYFTQWVLKRVRGYVGRVDHDLIVRTTFVPHHQALLVASRAPLKPLMVREHVGQLASVSMRQDGAVTAMLGGSNWQKSPFNRATQAQRQPGSTFKLFVYLTAFERGYTPDTIMNDHKLKPYEGWSPHNAHDIYKGRVTLREGFALSLNSIAVALAEKVGVGHVIELARRLGVTAPLKPRPSLALGTFGVPLIDIVGAYATVAHNGFLSLPYGIMQIQEVKGRTLYRHRAEKKRVLSPVVVGFMKNLLRAVTVWGTGRTIGGVLKAAGKTGTTQDHRDAWFVGYAGDLVAGVWMGNDDDTPMKGTEGGSLPALFWGRFMNQKGGGCLSKKCSSFSSQGALS